MVYDKKKLKAIRLLVFSDKTKKEIAKDLGITEQTLYNWLKEGSFNNLLHSESKVYFSYIRKKTFKKLNSLLLKAYDVIANSLRSPSEKIGKYCIGQLCRYFTILLLFFPLQVLLSQLIRLPQTQTLVSLTQ